ncbi:MAG TPA: cation-translocating P-type ATPase [Fervidobacterium sp.]|nr:cation-translocating P-type ATPase [Fervidobacterium sp.]
METKKSLKITGMTCANCARIVEKSLSKVDGVKFAAVNLATNTAFVILDKEIPDGKLKEAVEKVGYGVSDEPSELIEEKRLRRIRSNMLISVIITVPLMVLMFMHMGGVHIPYFNEIELVLSFIVIFYAGRDTIRGATIALLHRHSNMDTLILFGAATAWFTNILAYTSLNIHAFGTVGAMIVMLHLIGRYIESYLRDRASKQVKELLALQSKEARVLINGEEIMMPIEAVKEGSIVIVRPGERIPLDGLILEGSSSIDESMLTGEPIPAFKEIDNEVIGGSLNLSGALKIRVTKTGEDSFLAKMLSLIEEVQGAKVPIQALADRITNWFVPGVITLAVISGLLWYFNFDGLNMLTHSIREILPWTLHTTDSLSFSIFVFLTTVVIACPCALGLATPMALIVGTSLAAKKGLLIRNAEAIQTAKEVGYVLVDKTGTLTLGTPKVVESTVPQVDAQAVASIESLSIHPLAKAIVEYVDKPIMDSIEDFQELHGQGVVAKVGTDEYFIGKPSDTTLYDRYTSEGKTVVEVLKNGNKCGYFVIEDVIREDSAQAIAKLKSMNITPVMVTGDNENTAKYVARIVGIEEVYANKRPDEKIDIVRHYQSMGKKVIMVGDGINDAAALKGADIGIAIGSGSDLAIDNADIIITKGGISKIVDAIIISKATFKSIKQNLTFAFFYNVLAIPLAMLGMLHPAIAEGAMALSSITVILNSLRINSAFSNDSSQNLPTHLAGNKANT